MPPAGQPRAPLKKSGAGSLGGRQFVDLSRGAYPRLQRALDPGVVERAVLAGEVAPPLRLEDGGLEGCLLLGREQGEGAACPAVAVPGVRRAPLEPLADARVDLLDVVERLLDAGLLVHRAPLQRVLAPGVRGEQHAARGRVVGRWVVQAAHGQVGHAGATDDAILALPDALADLEQDLARSVVVELADGALLLVAEAMLDRPQHGEGHGADGVVAAE